MHRRVKVLLYGQVVGELSQNDSGFLFQYAPDYHGPAISISLPVAQRQFPSEMFASLFRLTGARRMAASTLQPDTAS